MLKYNILINLFLLYLTKIEYKFCMELLSTKFSESYSDLKTEFLYILCEKLMRNNIE